MAQGTWPVCAYCKQFSNLLPWGYGLRPDRSITQYNVEGRRIFLHQWCEPKYRERLAEKPPATIPSAQLLVTGASPTAA